jgi:triosephosphate isomerase
MKRFVIAGNWKMNLNRYDVIKFFDSLNQKQKEIQYENITMIICPVFPLLYEAMIMARNTNILIGAQDVSSHKNGAYTGEVSADILDSISVKYCIIGHSERRQYHNETDDIIKEKWLQLRAHKINPIICIGETLQEREAEKTFDVISSQIEKIFNDMKLDKDEDCMIAYEPVWAIGTGKTATPEQAQEVHAFINDLLNKKYGTKRQYIPLLYGGSVKPSNIKDLLSQNDIDGALIGGASLVSDEYLQMINITGEIV